MIMLRKHSKPRAPRRVTARPWLIAVLATVLVSSACRVDTDDVSVEGLQGDQSDEIVGSTGSSTDEASGQQASDDPASDPIGTSFDMSPSPVECRLPGDGIPTGLTEIGQQTFVQTSVSKDAMPTYQLSVAVEPSTGAVAGSMRADLPSADGDYNLRMFAGMDSFDAGLSITNVRADGRSVDADLDIALLTVPNNSDDSTVIELDFSYTVGQMAANESLFGGLTGETLQPDQIGLLGRTDTGMQLGHWFPVWLPEGTRADPDPSGFGDIGAFPTASICATIRVPAQYTVVTGGIRLATEDSSIIEGGTGLRDFSMLISDDIAMSVQEVDGVEVRVWGPPDQPAALIEVLDYAVVAQQALVEAFGPYPWIEVDIVSAPLGGGVGGMEWPGMVWVERSLFAGGFPGLGDLGALFGDSDLEALLGDVGGAAISTTLEWTIAHELGHEWWHALVGNDSIESPAVDEPLAQFAACIAMQQIHPDNWRAICEAQTVDQFAQSRALGVTDAVAEQPSDAFESSLQYGAVIYGKAPGFYLAAGDLIGWQALTDSLKSFAEQNAFALVSTDALRAHLIDAAGDDGPTIEALWDRWFREEHGDEDIEAADLFGDLNLEEFFGNVENGDLDLEELFGNLESGDLDLEELFGNLENGDLDIEALLEDLLGD